MEFVTTEGKLKIQDNKIIHERLTNKRWPRILLSLYFFLFFIDLTLKEIDKLTELGKQSAWIGIILYGLPVVAYVVYIIVTLFRDVLVNKVDITKIAEVKILDTDNGLDKDVLLKTKSNRYKLYKFRFLEKEYDRFTEQLLLLNSNIKVSTQ